MSHSFNKIFIYCFQCSLFWACNDYDDLESVSKDERMEMDAKISQKSMSLSPIEAPVKECNSDALDLGLTGLPALLQNALKRQQAMTPSGGSDRQSSPSPKSEMEEVLNARKIQDVISQITAQSCNGERPSKIRYVKFHNRPLFDLLVLEAHPCRSPVNKRGLINPGPVLNGERGRKFSFVFQFRNAFWHNEEANLTRPTV